MLLRSGSEREILSRMWIKETRTCAGRCLEVFLRSIGTQPYTIIIESNHTSNDEAGYMKVFVPCGGADDPRPIKLRQRGSDGKWFLWEQYLLTGVRTPKAADPWA